MLPKAPNSVVHVDAPPPNLIAGLRRNAWTIALVAVFVTLVAVGASLLQPKRYTSEASVVLQTSGDTGAAPNMATEKQIASSNAVAGLVVRSLQLQMSPEEASQPLSVSVPVDASVLVFSYSSPDPRDAQRGAQAFADAYLSYRHDALLHEAQSANAVADARITELQNELKAVTKKQATATTHSKVEAYRVAANALFAQIGVEEQRAAAAAGSFGSVGDRLVAATLPTAPSQPKLVLNGLLGVFIGLSLGTLVALWHTSFKRRVQTEEDVEQLLDMPLLAVIPESDGRPWSPSLVSAGERSATTDAYRELVAKLLSMQLLSSNGHGPAPASADRPIHTIAVVPLDERADAASVAANVGVAIALSGQQVVYVSTTATGAPDLFPKNDSGPGLVDVTAGRAGLAAAIRPTEINGLRALPRGRDDESWALLDAWGVHRTLRDVSALADFVVVPATGLAGSGIEPTALVAACDAVLYVGTLRSTNADDAREVRADLEPLGKPTLGAVMFRRARSGRRIARKGDQPRVNSSNGARTRSRRRRSAAGDPPKRKALRHVIRSRISEHPNVYLPLARVRYRGPSPKVVTHDTELVIDGYTRSACTFAVYAFQLAQQAPRHGSNRSSSGNGAGSSHGPVRIAHHLHAPAQLLEAARRELPTIVVIREPEGAILSQLLQEPNVAMSDALVSYERFYSLLIPHGSSFVAGEFDEVTNDFGAVIRRLNKRFHTHYRTFNPTDENTRECLDLMTERPTADPEWREMVLGFESGAVPLHDLLAHRAKRNGHAPSVTDTWIPSKEREKAKEVLRSRWNAPTLAPLRERASAAYHDFLRAAGAEQVHESTHLG